MTRIKASQEGRKTRVSKTDWLDAGLDTLKRSGIEAVRVERLAAQLGVAKSGFYYHFRDREDLCNKMLDHWLAMDAAPLLRERLFKSITAEERLRIVSEVVDSEDLSRFDMAIRQWARSDLRVRRIWRKEMTKRLEHIRGIFRELGFTGDALDVRVRAFVGYEATERELFADLSRSEREKLRDMRIAILTKRD